MHLDLGAALDLTSSGRQPNARTLGHYLGQRRGRILGGMMFESPRVVHKTSLWQVVPAKPSVADQVASAAKPSTNGTYRRSPEAQAKMDAALDEARRLKAKASRAGAWLEDDVVPAYAAENDVDLWGHGE